MEKITFDGMDGDYLATPSIVVWRGRDKERGSVGTVGHGDPGWLLERQDDFCKVRFETGRLRKRTREGWVRFWFVRELKSDWNEERRAELGPWKMKLKNGTVLDLCSAPRLAVDEIILRLGGMQAIEDPGYLHALEGEDKERAAENIENLFMLLAGWGVLNDPPEEDHHLVRALWLRYVVFADADDEEISEFIGRGLLLSQVLEGALDD